MPCHLKRGLKSYQFLLLSSPLNIFFMYIRCGCSIIRKTRFFFSKKNTEIFIMNGFSKEYYDVELPITYLLTYLLSKEYYLRSNSIQCNMIPWLQF
jgi:hypothetical protein